jgi:CubicO group peptidase (beta-lactamase class C family)
MARTRPTLSAAAALDNVAVPHDRVDGALRTIDNASVDSVSPAGSVWSSASDMSRWLRMLLAEGQWEGRQVLSPEAVAELLRPQTLLDLAELYPLVPLLEPHWTSYALGWFQADYRGRAVSFHTGSIDGMSAIAALVPDEELGVVVLANRDHAELRHALVWKAIDLWGGEEEGRDWSADLAALYGELAAQAADRRAELEAARIEGTEPALPLEDYAGVYRDEIYDEAYVELGEAGLVLRLAPTLAGPLEHWHHETFRVKFDRPWRGDALATFALGPDGRPARLEILGLTYEREADPPGG